MAATSDALGLYSQLIAAILAKMLSEGGLRRIRLSWTEFGEVQEDLGVPSNDDFAGMFEDSVKWLSDEGYIRSGKPYSGNDNEGVYPDCVLTAKCLAALDQRIEALGATGRDIIKQNSAGDVGAGNYVKAGSLLGGILGGFTKSIG